MMLEIPNDKPFTVERQGKMGITVLRTGVVLKCYVDDPYKDLVILTLSAEEAVMLGGFFMSAGGPPGSRAGCELVGGTFVEGKGRDDDA